jgi:hypothetical protein
MMVNFGEPEVLKRQMAKTVYGIVWREITSFHLLEQLANGTGIQVVVAGLTVPGKERSA